MQIAETVIVTSNFQSLRRLSYYKVTKRVDGKDSVQAIPYLVGPGANEISISDWERIEIDPTVKQYVADGDFDVDTNFDIDKIREKRFLEILEATASMSTMTSFLGNTKKNDRRKLIEERIEEIKRTTEPT